MAQTIGGLVVCGVGAAVDVAIGLQAVLGCSHHVGGFYRRPENRRADRGMKTHSAAHNK